MVAIMHNTFVECRKKRKGLPVKTVKRKKTCKSPMCIMLSTGIASACTAVMTTQRSVN